MYLCTLDMRWSSSAFLKAKDYFQNSWITIPTELQKRKTSYLSGFLRIVQDYPFTQTYPQFPSELLKLNTKHFEIYFYSFSFLIFW